MEEEGCAFTVTSPDTDLLSNLSVLTQTNLIMLMKISNDAHN